MQDRGLRHRPAGQRPDRVGLARDADDAFPAQVHADRHVGDLPVHRAVVVLAGAVLDGQQRRLADGADAQQQVVGVAAAAFPQPGAGADGPHAGGGRVGPGGDPQAALALDHALDVVLQRGAPGAVVGDRGEEVAPAAAPGADVVADGEHRAEEREHQVEVRVQEDDHADAHEHRRYHHQQRDGAPGRW